MWLLLVSMYSVCISKLYVALAADPVNVRAKPADDRSDGVLEGTYDYSVWNIAF